MKRRECVKYKNLLFRFGDYDISDCVITNTLFWFDNINNIDKVYYYPLYAGYHNEYIDRYINLVTNLNKIYSKNEVDRYFFECYNHNIDFLYYDISDIDLSLYKDYRMYCNYKLVVYGDIIKNNNIDMFNGAFRSILKFDTGYIGCANIKNSVKGVDDAIKLDINSPEIRMYLYNVYNKVISDDLYNYYMKQFDVRCDRNKFKKDFIVYFYSADKSGVPMLIFAKNVDAGNTDNLKKFDDDLVAFKAEIINKYNNSGYINDFFGRRIDIVMEQNESYDKFFRRVFAVYLQSSVTNYNFKVAYDLLNCGFNILYISREEIIVNGGSGKLDNINNFFDNYMMYVVNKYHN